MKKIVWFIALLCGVIGMDAQDIRSGQMVIKNLSVTHNADRLFVTMEMDMSEVKLKSAHELMVTPALVAAGEHLELPSVVIAGRNRYYYYLRNGEELKGRRLCRAKKTEAVHYETSVPYEGWMETSELVLEQDSCGCSDLIVKNDDLLAALDFRPKVFTPVFVFIQPEVEAVKERHLDGQAYIDFPVNRTEIYPDYRRNPEELKKIIATIDEVKNNPDTRITSLHIKGYASPEGSYANNTRLAKGRTETLKDYVQDMYSFADGVIHTGFEPEDWAGLRRNVEASSLEHRDAILAVIDGSLTPDAKDRKIKADYPQEYAYLLREVYPGLRHSDYVVEYVVRAYTDVEEAKRVLADRPGNLSLDELYMIAASYPQGSDEYSEVFATAVRLFPDDEVANLNAANVAMSRKDLTSAKKYLAKAGDMPQATYARGVCAALEGDYDRARSLLQKAKEQGVAEAGDALNRIEQISPADK